ncbi:MAG: hypothetical protein KTR31_38180 [Myxococcales bacterium]|nr:hypothetical protein [Myxococcales bacterium]
MPIRLSHLATLTALLCGCARYEGTLDVDLSTDVPVFHLLDHAGRAPDQLLVESCEEDGDTQFYVEMWSARPQGLDDWPIAYGDRDLGTRSKPLEDGILYQAIASTVVSPRDPGLTASGADWFVSFQLDSGEVTMGGCRH